LVSLGVNNKDTSWYPMLKVPRCLPVPASETKRMATRQSKHPSPVHAAVFFPPWRKHLKKLGVHSSPMQVQRRGITINSSNEPVMVAHVCNPSYSGGGNRKVQSSRPAHPKKVSKTTPPTLTNKLDVVTQASHPSYMGIINRWQPRTV
jgi:hypothetical protein